MISSTIINTTSTSTTTTTNTTAKTIRYNDDIIEHERDEWNEKRLRIVETKNIVTSI
jgi:hypothetical protein